MLLLQLAINEASGLKVAAHLATEKSEYVYRCYLALGEFRVIFNEITDAPNTPICKYRTFILPFTALNQHAFCGNKNCCFYHCNSTTAVKLLATVMNDAPKRDIAALQSVERMDDSSYSNCNNNDSSNTHYFSHYFLTCCHFNGLCYG